MPQTRRSAGGAGAGAGLSDPIERDRSLRRRGSGYCENMTELPEKFERPDGVDAPTVEAVGALTLAMETIIRARGALYEFHQLTGKADNEVIKAVGLLRGAGHERVADEVERDILGRNVNDRRWTFQIVEDYEQTYYEPFVERHRRVRDQLVDGRRHQREAEMKQHRATPNEPGHGF